MRFGDSDESDNIEDRRGSSGGIGGGTIGVGTLVLALVAWYFGLDPRPLLQHAANHPTATQQQAQPSQESPHEKQTRHFVAQVLGDTEKTWAEVLAAQGVRYVNPRLVLFRGATQTACGQGKAAMGPFYCPADQKVYLDLGFYDQLERRFNAPGNAAQAYVIAHEIGHHVQNLIGISGKVDRARQNAVSDKQSNALSVRLELQADCFAGVWFNQANRRHPILEAGDIDGVLTAASAIGDDTLQKESSGQVMPDSFTHGSSAQRTQWFRRGFDAGRIEACDTFHKR
jgi:predicted metalloprotease